MESAAPFLQPTLFGAPCSTLLTPSAVTNLTNIGANAISTLCDKSLEIPFPTMVSAKETAVSALCGGAVGIAGTLATQSTIVVLTPWMMSTFGTVVAGTGTLQAAWLGPAMAFAAAPVLTVAAVPILAGTTLGAGVYVLHCQRNKARQAVPLEPAPLTPVQHDY